jgi:aminomuconate-semialdehyde/2-hydroxymuconate-6-semialdehyde dehydrogenase
MSDVSHIQNSIGGAWVPASGEAWLDNLAPATGQLLSRIPKNQAEDVAAAVAAASKALQGPWGSSSASERADLLDAVASGIEARLDEFAEMESRDTGKPITLARTIDIPRAIANFRFFAGAIRHDETGCQKMPAAINYTVRKALGVVALITPWNLPLYLLSWKTAPALAMGNTVVAKPSEMTPMTATLLAEVFHDVGAPAGIFNLVHGLGTEAGQALVEHPDVAAVSFTGGTATGAMVARTASPQFKKVSLELGGKNPTLVFADCDFDKAVEGAVRAAFTNQGEICLCGSRVLVEESICERFTEAFVAQVRAMTPGDPSDPSTKVGALISNAHREKVESYVSLAREEGGTIACGGVRPQLQGDLSGGFFLEPTVVTGLPPTCRTATEEVFGPLVTIHSFKDDEEALSIANSVRYGLSASVWTQNLKRAHRVSEALDTGMVWVNTWLLRDLRVPFGGVKDSGVGREGGHYSLEFFSNAQNICIYTGD